MKYTFLLALKGLRFRKFNSILLLVGTILGMMFFIITSVIGDSMNATILEERLDSYGEQKLLVTSDDATVLDDIKSDPFFKGFGVMYTAAVCLREDGSPLYIGYADETAISLGHLDISEGKMPEKSGEIALERSMLHNLGYKEMYNIGDEIILNLNLIKSDGNYDEIQKSYIITGFIKEYTDNWEKNTADSGQTEDYELGIKKVFPIKPFSAFISYEEYISLNVAFPEILLLKPDMDNTSDFMSKTKGNVFFYINIAAYPEIANSIINNNSFSQQNIILLINAMILIGTAFFIANAFIMSLDKRKLQFALMRSIGATKIQSARLVLFEALLLAGISIPLGILAGALLSFIAVNMVAAISGYNLEYSLNIGLIPIAALIGFISILAAVAFPAIKASTISPMSGLANLNKSKKNIKYRKKNRRQTPLGLTLNSLKNNKLRTVITVASFIICFLILNMIAFINNTTYAHIDSNNADYMLQGIPSPYNTYTYSTLTVTGASIFDLELYEKLDNITEIKSVITTARGTFWVIFNKNYLEGYLENHYEFYRENMIINGIWSSSDEEKKFNTVNGYKEDELLILPDITVYNSESINELGKYVVEGTINSEALVSGEEVLICMPDYYTISKKISSQYNSGNFFTDWVYSTVYSYQNSLPPLGSTLFSYKDYNTFRAGDIITLTHVSLDENGKYLRKDIKIKIGAILNYDTPMKMIFTYDALDLLGLQYNPYTFMIYLKDSALAIKVDDKIKELTADMNDKHITIKTDYNTEQLKGLNTVKTIGGLLCAAVGIFGMIGLANTVNSRIYNRKREIYMLRAVGMTKGQVLRMFLYEGCIYGLVSSAVGTAIFFSFLNNTFFIGTWLSLVSIPVLILSIISLCAIGILTIFIPVKNLNNTSIIDGIKIIN